MFLWDMYFGADTVQGVPATTARAHGIRSTTALLDNEALWNAHPCQSTVDTGTDGDADWRRVPHDDEESELPEDVHLVRRRIRRIPVHKLILSLVNKSPRIQSRNVIYCLYIISFF